MYQTLLKEDQMKSKAICTILMTLSLGVFSAAVASAQNSAAKLQATQSINAMAPAPNSFRATADRQPSHAEVKQYKMHNHPSNVMGPPLYGLRLDDLLESGVCTFSFDYSDATGSSSMSIEIDDNAGTIRIWGRAFGGLHTGAGYDAEQSGWVAIDFTYRVNILKADNVLGDFGDDLFVLFADITNHGTIELLGWGGDQTIEISDLFDCAYTFEFDNDFDHNWNASFATNPRIWSGSGYLQMSNPGIGIGSNNWSFWAEEIVAVAVQENTWSEVKRLFAQ
jgi:hypothetical protein